MITQAKPKRRWLQYSLRTFLLAITAAAVGLGIGMKRAHRRARVLGEIRAMRAYVRTTADGPAWLRGWLGRDYFVKVQVVGLDHTLATDENLRLVSELTDLQTLYVGGELTFEQGGPLSSTSYGFEYRSPDGHEMYPTHPAAVTDRGLQHLRALTNLEQLALICCPQVTDEGIAFLEHCDKLEKLKVVGIEMTDRGLQRLKGAASLRLVEATKTKITYDGIDRLQMDRPQLEVWPHALWPSKSAGPPALPHPPRQ